MLVSKKKKLENALESDYDSVSQCQSVEDEMYQSTTSLNPEKVIEFKMGYQFDECDHSVFEVTIHPLTLTKKAFVHLLID